MSGLGLEQLADFMAEPADPDLAFDVVAHAVPPPPLRHIRRTSAQYLPTPLSSNRHLNGSESNGSHRADHVRNFSWEHASTECVNLKNEDDVVAGRAAPAGPRR